jgi:SAM-dependent methyltransferase
MCGIFFRFAEKYLLKFSNVMSCVVCGSDKYSEVIYNNHQNSHSLKSIAKNFLPYFSFAIPKTFGNLRKLAIGRRYFKGKNRICLDCGHGYLVNPPNSDILIKYYKRAYWSHRSDLRQNDFAKNKNYLTDFRAIQQVAILSKHIDLISIENVLEIGAGPANASLLLKHQNPNQFINLFVYEPGTQWEEYYKENQITKIGDYFPSVTELKFDYIHTSHWLEHTNNLDNTISQIKKLLSASGKVFVEVPNEQFYYWNLQIEDTPHLQFFTPASLRKSFENNGFKCLFIKNFGPTYLERSKGITIGEYNSVENSEGFWIRALFELC